MTVLSLALTLSTSFYICCKVNWQKERACCVGIGKYKQIQQMKCIVVNFVCKIFCETNKQINNKCLTQIFIANNSPYFGAGVRACVWMSVPNCNRFIIFLFILLRVYPRQQHLIASASHTHSINSFFSSKDTDSSSCFSSSFLPFSFSLFCSFRLVLWRAVRSPKECLRENVYV